jgi:hypothetical protein
MCSADTFTSQRLGILVRILLVMIYLDSIGIYSMLVRFIGHGSPSDGEVMTFSVM